MTLRSGRRLWLAAVLVVATSLSISTMAAAARPHRRMVPDGDPVTRVVLFMNDVSQGVLNRLEGCGQGAAVVGPETWEATDLRLGELFQTPCVLTHQRLGKAFMAWLRASLAGRGRAADLALVSYSTLGRPVRAILLREAWLTRFELPTLDAADTPGNLRSTVVAASIESAPVGEYPNLSTSLPKGWTTFRVLMGDTVLSGVSTVSGLTVTAAFGDGIVSPNDPGATLPGIFHPSLLVIEASGATRNRLDDWLQEVLDGASERERELTIELVTNTVTPLVTVALGGVGMSGASSGLGGPRAYAFYVETVTLS